MKSKTKLSEILSFLENAGEITAKEKNELQKVEKNIDLPKKDLINLGDECFLKFWFLKALFFYYMGEGIKELMMVSKQLSADGLNFLAFMAKSLAFSLALAESNQTENCKSTVCFLCDASNKCNILNTFA